LEILFAPVTPETLPRAAQLTQRTNQMNTSLVRYTEPELSAALAAGKQAFTVTVSDRFGSYGLVGLVLFREEASAVHIENFLLSCRALGRGVEYKMLVHAAELAGGRSAVKVDIRRGPRNQPALQFIQALQTAPLPTTEESVLEFPAATLLNLSFPPQTVPQPAERQLAEPRPPGSGLSQESPQPPYQRIAETLTTASRIRAAVSAARRERAPIHRKQATPPQNELQARLAAIWSSLLGLDEVGIDEDFFDLGGHSLIAVQLLSRIHQDMNVDLPDSVIYGEKLRIDNLARAIELHQLGVSDQSAYDAMLAEIESLSDEEVAALLAQEEGNA
jgi:acyl carrier protein